ncbi:MAG: aquaporin, partial [Chloroflexi bacterium]|nr:aquaporin [Chloroflexota bacterium]
PAVSLAFAIFRRDQFPVNRLFAYWGAQLIGAVIAGVVVLILFNPFIDRFEMENGIVRGELGSQRSAMAFGEYFPNPGMFDSAAFSVSPLHAFAVEAFGTAILAFVIFALTERRNAGIPTNGMVPFFIGFTVAALISLFAPITQAGWNPARDFGPRIVSWLAGWGDIAIPGPEGGFWVYILGPLIGAPLGALLFKLVIEPGLPGGKPEPVQIARSKYE